MKKEVTITREELIDAVAKATNDVCEHDEVDLKTEVMIILTGGLIVSRLVNVLFKEDE